MKRFVSNKKYGIIGAIFLSGGFMFDNLLTLGWGSPIGIGIFLVCLGGMIYLLSKASKKDK
jgi:hypothetical protein